MGSILGAESEEIARIEAQIRSSLEYESDARLRAALKALFAELEAARERYWERARELHQLREALKLSV